VAWGLYSLLTLSLIVLILAKRKTGLRKATQVAFWVWVYCTVISLAPVTLSAASDKDMGGLGVILFAMSLWSMGWVYM
jgi:hypothetical protein